MVETETMNNDFFAIGYGALQTTLKVSINEYFQQFIDPMRPLQILFAWFDIETGGHGFLLHHKFTGYV